MKKLLVVLAIVAAGAAAYLLSMSVLNRRVRSALARYRTAGHPTRLAELVVPATDPGREAARLLALADTALDHRQEGPVLARVDSGAAFTPDELRQIDARNSHALDLLNAASRLPARCVEADYTEGLATRLPAAAIRMSDFGNLLRLHARVLANDGKYEPAIDQLMAVLRLVNVMPDRFLVTSLIQAAQYSHTLPRIREIAPRCSDQTLLAVEQYLAGFDPRTRFRASIEAEAVVSREWLVTFRPRYIALYMPEASARSWFATITLVLPPVNRWAQVRQLDLVQRQLDLFEKPWFESRAEWARVDSELGRQGLISCAGLTPRVRLFSERCAQIESELDVTLLGLRVLRFQRLSGRIPESLALLDARAIDPFTGRDYIYRPGPRGFLLYGVGRNLKDDAGDPKNDIVWKLGS